LLSSEDQGGMPPLYPSLQPSCLAVALISVLHGPSQ